MYLSFFLLTDNTLCNPSTTLAFLYSLCVGFFDRAEIALYFHEESQ